MKRKKLIDFGYPEEGIIYVSNGWDDYEVPQEALSPHTCASCRKLTKDWECSLTGEEKDPDSDSCENIDYVEDWVDSEYGFRAPVRCEYSSDRAYKCACEAIKAINSLEDY